MDHNILDEHLRDQPTNAPEHAGFSIRFGAALLDGLFLLPLTFLSFWNLLEWKSLPLMILVSLVTIAYKPFFEFFYQATLGKHVIGLQVLNDYYRPITLEQSFLRSAPWVITGLLSLSTNITIFRVDQFYETETLESLTALLQQHSGLGNQLASWMIVISCMFVVFDKNKQALHDQLARTFCVYKPTPRDQRPS